MAKQKPRKHKLSAKDHSGKHHIIPSSRGGGNEKDNLYRWAESHGLKHSAWHALFINKMPEEVIALLATWTRKDGELDMRYFTNRKGLNRDKLYYWDVVFGNMRSAEAIAWVEQEFVRKDWLRRRKDE